MKKLLFLIFCATTLLSCTNSAEEETGIIVGTWNLFSINGDEVSDCEKRSFVAFFSNNTAIGEDYFPSINNGCKRDGASETIQWVNNGNNTYLLSPNTDLFE